MVPVRVGCPVRAVETKRIAPYDRSCSPQPSAPNNAKRSCDGPGHAFQETTAIDFVITMAVEKFVILFACQLLLVSFWPKQMGGSVASHRCRPRPGQNIPDEILL